MTITGNIFPTAFINRLCGTAVDGIHKFKEKYPDELNKLLPDERIIKIAN